MSMRKKKKGENNQWDEKKGGKKLPLFPSACKFSNGDYVR